MIKPSNLHYKIIAYGYSMFFRGIRIGGDIFSSASRARKQAKKERDLILSGFGDEYFMSAIREINHDA
jgi:hypothetical protein